MQNKLRTDKLDGLCQTIRAGRFKGGMAIWIAGDECGSAVLQGQEKEKFPPDTSGGGFFPNGGTAFSAFPQKFPSIFAQF